MDVTLRNVDTDVIYTLRNARKVVPEQWGQTEILRVDFEDGEGDQGYREWAWYYDAASGREFMSRVMILPDGEISERWCGVWAVRGFSMLGNRDWNVDGIVGSGSISR